MYRTPCCNAEIPCKAAYKSMPLWPIKCPDCGTKYHNGKFNMLTFSATVLMFVSLGVFIYLGMLKETTQVMYFLVVGTLSVLATGYFEERRISKVGKLTKTTRGSQLRFLVLLSIFVVYSIYSTYEGTVLIYSDIVAKWNL